jgi:hypothetical protein
MALSQRKYGASMVTVTINEVAYEVSNSIAAALFSPLPGEGRVHPVTTKVSAKQKAWLIEQSGKLGTTQSTLIANLIDKEMENE